MRLTRPRHLQMHTMLVERSKKMRDGPGPNSYKQNDGDILEDFVRRNPPLFRRAQPLVHLCFSSQKTNPALHSSFRARRPQILQCPLKSSNRRDATSSSLITPVSFCAIHRAQYMGNDASGNLDDHGDHGLDHGLNYDMQVLLFGIQFFSPPLPSLSCDNVRTRWSRRICPCIRMRVCMPLREKKGM